jgi:hypothetical protein
MWRKADKYAWTCGAGAWHTNHAHSTCFFQRLYDLYDLRFGYPDPDGPNIRKAWLPQFEGLPKTIDKDLPFRWQPRLAA